MTSVLTGQWTAQPLESALWSGPGSTVVCRVCGADNRLTATTCRECFAPVAVRFPEDRKPSPPHLLAVLGPPHVGKTCYLGMLADMLARGESDMRIYSHGAVSVALQQHTMSSLARRRFPPSTPIDPAQWCWMHCDVQLPKSKRPLEVLLPDVSGETAMAELEGTSPQVTLTRLLRYGTAGMVLIDGAELSLGCQASEYAAQKIIGSLLTLPTARKQKRWSDRPLAIVITKIDSCDWASDNPEEFVRRHAPGLWRLCHDQFRKVQCFATSVGVTTRAWDFRGMETEVLLRAEPRGVLAPFHWLLGQLGARS